MSSDLLVLVQENLLPRTICGLHVVQDEEAEFFGDAHVILASDDVRIRILGERDMLFVDFGSAAAPSEWFDSAVVMEYLGLSETAGWHSDNPISVLKGLASFLSTFRQELQLKLGRTNFSRTQQQLVKVREAQDARRFG